jgi:hypothetical protein
MPNDGWSALYISVPTRLKKRVEDAAAADDRKVAKWIERLLTEHFERVDAQCDLNTSSPDTSCASSELDSSPSSPE